MKTIEVVAAIILVEGKVLCMQRNHSKYESGENNSID